MKKSKFLKKSLAMLLALMLVVAMIPLSASASPINLETIYVDGNKVTLGENFTVDVSTTATEVKVGTNEDLSQLANNKHELRVSVPGSVEEKVIGKWDANTDGTPLDFATYAENDAITFVLYDMTTNLPTGKKEATYTMKLNKVVTNTETNLSAVDAIISSGVYKVTNTLDEINETKIIKVQLPRDTQSTSTYDPKITVVGANGATINGTKNGSDSVSAKDGATFTVTSASGNNTSKFTVKASYLDALESFTVTGSDGVDYEGEIIDENNDDIPDKIVVTLADEAINDSYGDPMVPVKLDVSYTVNGDLYNKLTITDDGSSDPVTVKTGDTFTFTGLNDSTAYNGTVTVTRGGGAVQTYDLVVQMEKSDSTVIEKVMVNNTEADISGNPITAELPANWIDNKQQKPTSLDKLNVVITTPATVSKVTLAGLEGQKGTPAGGSVTWTWGFTSGVDTVNLATEKAITVYAEDGTTMAQTGIVATFAQRVSSATITGFTLGKYSAESIENNVITVRVPYMTTNVASWKVYATASAGAKVVAVDNTGMKTDVINGSTIASVFGLGANITDAKNGLISTGTINAVAMNGDVESKYTVKVVLEDAKPGKELKGIDFTVQSDSNDDDESVYRAITDANSFHANVAQATDGSRTVGEINMKIPPSLTDANDLGIDYQNIVTGFQKEGNAVVYAVTDRGNGAFRVTALTATTDDDDDTTITGKILTGADSFGGASADYSKNQYDADDTKAAGYCEILVLPEEIARKVELGQMSNNSEGRITQADALKYGNLYEVVIDADDPETEAQLKTIKIGEKELTINPDMTITGELPWSYTATSKETYSKSMFAEFTISDYAVLIGTDDQDTDVAYFSKGDWDGDGVEDAVGTPATSTEGSGSATVTQYNNRKFLFVQNEDGKSVDVYVCNGKDASALLKDGEITVKGENRLTAPDDYSSKTYKFELTFAQPSNETVLSNFKLGSYTGVIDGLNITVNVPYGTDVTGLIATFDKSIGSKVTINGATGVDFVSGITSANYSTPVKLHVVSESGKNAVDYTVTVNQGLHFSDISESDWYYENVMTAANNGYISGFEDGTFRPKQATTRAQFASMIANAMGYTAQPDVDSMFPDVADTYWGKNAINFCAQNDIITGYEDGTFQPDKAVTRQEAASMLRNAFKLTETTSELYPDDASISKWAKESVYLVKASGLMKGDAGTGNFRPTSTIIRAEAASIFVNAKVEGLIK